ncbi:DUF6968 family protein [Polyangium jinanense]|uniref:DUF6968 domain-containing protein n=1 Tax=Polyangium jinanense TaxID=2829994 RepID=A0A9X3XC22_9BACT|nr:hypothetical protein [Polyangium jinanense]MDC3960030.1 hypothetical protein [Polyangium jinanense]MDC3986248.1 hypothetical protein [Polyangium jinanense]
MTTSKPRKTTSKTKRPRWIAERRLERRDAVGGIVVVRIGSPELPPGDEVWRCPFVILGLGDDSIQFSKSIDSMAALQNALTGIRCKLVQSGIPLRWEGGEEGDPGFLVYVPSAFGLAFQQRMEKMIQAEIEELVRPISERHERREARRKARAKPRTE